jgi:hypothetical protein
MDLTKRDVKSIAVTFEPYLLDRVECFIEATEWQNSEGVHVTFGDEQELSITRQQLRALITVLNEFTYD